MMLRRRVWLSSLIIVICVVLLSLYDWPIDSARVVDAQGKPTFTPTPTRSKPGPDGDMPTPGVSFASPTPIIIGGPGVITAANADQLVEDDEVLSGPSSWVSHVTFSPNGRYLVAGGGDVNINLWELGTDYWESLTNAHTSSVTGISFSPDGTLFVSSSTDDTVRMWNFETRENDVVIQTPGDKWDTTFSHDGSFFAFGSDEMFARVYRTELVEPYAEVCDHGEVVLSIAFSPVTNTLACGLGTYATETGPIAVWTISDEPMELFQLQEHTGGIMDVTFSPDGSILASASFDMTVRLWEVATGAQIATLQGHTNWVRSVAFSPDGSLLASAAWDGTVRLWDVSTGDNLAVYTINGQNIDAVAFSPDGTILAVGSDDASVHLLRLPR